MAKKLPPRSQQKLMRGVESWFECHQIEGLDAKLAQLPGGVLKVYFSSSMMPEAFDPARFVLMEWVPVRMEKLYEDWWTYFHVKGREVIAEQTGIAGQSSPLWCLGIDFIPNRKGGRA